jgi:transposase
VEVHKVAVQLYAKEREKSTGIGMLCRQVAAQIEAKYDIGPRYSTITQYKNEGLVNECPKRTGTGPCSKLSNESYKLLSDAWGRHPPVFVIFSTMT